jgi:zinc protease
MVFLYRDRVEAMTPKLATQVAAEFLRPANRTVGMFLPTKAPARAPLTEAPDVVAMVKDYKGRAAAAKGEDFAPTLENIQARTTVKTLPSGIEVALLPKETRGDVVVAQLGLHYGTEKDLTGKDTASGFIAPMLMRGSKRLSFDEIKTELDLLKAQVTMSGSDGFAMVNIRTTRGNLAATIALVSEVLREPVFPKDQFEILKKEAITSLEESLQNPAAQAQVAAQRRLNPYPKTDIRYVPTTQEQIARTRAVTVADVKRLYATLWGASHAELAVVGDFDPEELVAAVEKGLGDWKAPRRFERIATPYRSVAGVAEVIDTPDKESAQLMIAFPFAMREDHPDYPALRLANQALGSGMDSRLMSRLRQKEGLTYGTGSFVAIDALDERAAFYAVATVAPQNAERGLAILIEEIEKLITGGVDDAELAKSKGIFAQSYARQLTSDDTVAGILRQNLYFDRSLDFQRQHNAAIENLTVADIAAVLKKGYLKPEGFVKVTAGDMKKAKPQASVAN